MATKLVSKAELKTYLNFSGTGEDTLLDEIIEHVSSEIEFYCDRLFAAEAGRVEYPSGGTELLSLKLFPITSVASIYEDAEREFGSGTLLDSSNYYVGGDYAARGYVIRSNTWRRELSGVARSVFWIKGPNVIKVTYSGGYTVTDGVAAVPDSLKKTVLRQCAYLWDRRMNLGTASASGGDGSASFIGAYDLLPNVKRDLQPYRRINA